MQAGEANGHKHYAEKNKHCVNKDDGALQKDS